MKSFRKIKEQIWILVTLKHLHMCLELQIQLTPQVVISLQVETIHLEII